MKQQRPHPIRIQYIVTFLLLLLVEVGIALFVNDTLIRPYVGDVLVVAVLYVGYKSIRPDENRLLPLWIFIVAALVEYLQYVNIVESLGLAHISFFRILIGTSFDWMDLLCYAIGCLILYGAQLWWFHKE